MRLLPLFLTSLAVAAPVTQKKPEPAKPLTTAQKADFTKVIQPIFDALKPAEGGFVHAGSKPGAGHFAKMVHNGIEYAMMQAYAEGWELLEAVDLGELLAKQVE